MNAAEVVRRIREWYMGKYAGRPVDAVAVHELLRGYWALQWRGGRALTGVFLRGELIEEGVASVLDAEPAPRFTTDVTVPRMDAKVLDVLEAAGVAVEETRRGYRFPVTGATDLLLPDGTLVEVKSTRQRGTPTGLSEWVAQAAVYAEVYGRPVIVLLVRTSGDVALEALTVYPCEGVLRRYAEAFALGLNPLKAAGAPWDCVEEVGDGAEE